MQGAPSQTCTAWWLPDTSSSLRSRPKAWQLHRDWSSSPQSMLVPLYITHYQPLSFLGWIQLDLRPLRRTPSPLSTEPLLHQESQRSSGFWDREPHPAGHWRQVFYFNCWPANFPLGNTSWVGLIYCYPLFSRGRVIPASLEAKVIEAKQKVTHRNSSLEINFATDNCYYW